MVVRTVARPGAVERVVGVGTEISIFLPEVAVEAVVVEVDIPPVPIQ